MFRAAPADARVNLAVVGYGVTERLLACLDSLMRHPSGTDFTVTCVVNPRGTEPEPIDGLPAGVRIVAPLTNLGWAGGLHAARSAMEPGAEYFVWVQDDMEVLDGWLDALVAAADANQDAAAFGSVGVDELGRANAFSAGAAVPPDRMDLWNDTDTTRELLPDAPTRYDWVTSKGMLARLSAWDEVGGTDPRLFPLNHVDKDYCAHLRCHGWSVMLVPGARLRHAGDSSAPGQLRAFLPQWRSPRLDARWGAPLATLGSGGVGVVAHDCSAWSSADLDTIERLGAREAALMLVPFNRAVRLAHEKLLADVAAAQADARASWARGDALEAELAAAQARATGAEQEVAAMRASRSWRLTRPIRAIRRLFGSR